MPSMISTTINAMRNVATVTPTLWVRNAAAIARTTATSTFQNMAGSLGCLLR